MDSPSQSRQISISSSGYESSLTGSLSSLVSSDAFTEEHSTNGIKKCATFPRFDTIEDSLVMGHPSPGMPRSKSATFLEHYESEMELSLNDISSTGRNSPQIPSQKNISASRMSPPPSRDSGSVPLLKTSSREPNSEVENGSHDVNQKGNVAYPRFYRAMYSYNSQDDGEVTFNEGDEVEVIQRSENGWWLVRTSEDVGWGPSNFLQSLAY